MASERGLAQTESAEWSSGLCGLGVGSQRWGKLRGARAVINHWSSRRTLGRAVREGESPVGERLVVVWMLA